VFLPRHPVGSHCFHFHTIVAVVDTSEISNKSAFRYRNFAVGNVVVGMENVFVVRVRVVSIVVVGVTNYRCSVLFFGKL
jgi:hypothetical protein